jgi:hypothetical protein
VTKDVIIASGIHINMYDIVVDLLDTVLTQ